MQFKSERKIREAWRIVASGHEQWEQTGSIEPEHLATLRKVQIDMAQHLRQVRGRAGRPVHGMEYGRLLRHIEQIASDLICLSDQRVTHCASGAKRGGS